MSNRKRLGWWMVALCAVILGSLPSRSQAQGIDHSDWSEIVHDYGTTSGRFDYAALLNATPDLERLSNYITALGTADLSGLSRDDALAFWINAYNALVIKAVLDRYPIDSVMNVDGFFDSIQYQVAGESMTLNTLETVHIREAFSDPRVHFAVNCASRGCPPLRREAYTSHDLERQLAEQTTEFVTATSAVDGEVLHLNQIFEWYAADFGGVDGVRAFVAPYLPLMESALVGSGRVSVVYDEYDWRLNGR